MQYWEKSWTVKNNEKNSIFTKTSVLPPDVRTNYSSSLSPTTISRVMRGVGGGWIWGSWRNVNRSSCLTQSRVCVCRMYRRNRALREFFVIFCSHNCRDYTHHSPLLTCCSVSHIYHKDKLSSIYSLSKSQCKFTQSAQSVLKQIFTSDIIL